MKNKIKMIDLFSGAGGLTKGFWDVGFDPVISIEYDIDSVQTFNYNFHKKNVPVDILSSSGLKILKESKNLKDHILIGGFPCQGFSMAGKRFTQDPRNHLYKNVVKFIKTSNPKVFILENVKGIISMEKGKIFEEIMNKLNTNNLYTKYILLDSSNFGVPQKRERVIFIGGSKYNKEKVDKIMDLLSKHTEPIKNTKSALNDLLKNKEDLSFNHIFTNHSKKIQERMKILKEGSSLYKNYPGGQRKIFWYKPSPTVKENHGGVHIHPILNRALTPRELARLQTFPDDFIFFGSKTSQYKQIGNAVPVKMAFEIAKYVNEIFYKK